MPVSWSKLMADRWTGCLGIRLRPEAAAAVYGSSRGEPLAEATLVAGDAGEPGERQIWRLSGEAEGRPYDQTLTRHRDGSVRVHALSGAIRVNTGSGGLVVAADGEALARQLVTTYGLPLLLHDVPALALHACAAVPPGRGSATVVCGPSGAGKSSLLVAMIDAGWRPVAEDISVIDQRGGRPVVWPGAPWVRTTREGPRGATVSFQAVDKTAWDISAWCLDEPVAVERVIFMRSPGGDRPAIDDLDRAATIARLGSRTVWLLEPHLRAKAAFPQLVRFAGQVPAAELRLPVAEGWTELALEVLGYPTVRPANPTRKTSRRSVTHNAPKVGEAH